MYGIMIEELVIHEIRIDDAAGRGDSDSRMASFEVIMPLNPLTANDEMFRRVFSCRKTATAEISRQLYVKMALDSIGRAKQLEIVNV